jgi:hypothetical protein
MEEKKKSLVRAIRFSDLQRFCGLATWSFVTRTMRCNNGDKRRTCHFRYCPYWKELKEI